MCSHSTRDMAAIRSIESVLILALRRMNVCAVETSHQEVSGLFLPGSLLFAHAHCYFSKTLKDDETLNSNPLQRQRAETLEVRDSSRTEPKAKRSLCKPAGRLAGGLAKGWVTKREIPHLAAAGPARNAVERA